MTVWIENEHALVVGVVVRAKVGNAIVAAAGFEGGLVKGTDRIPTRRTEADVHSH